MCVYVKSGGARLSFSPHFRRGRKKTQKAAAVLAVFFLFHRRMMHIQFFWKFEKVFFFSPYMWQNGTHGDDVDISGLEIFQLFC